MPITKDEILANLALLDLSRLEKLYAYANTLLIPEEDLLVNATMSQMLDKAFALADTYFPKWTDRGPSDFGRFIIELHCLFSEKDFWYVNAFANEAIFSKISVYSDAFVRAVSLGYDPSLCKSSSAVFNVVFSPGAEYIYPIGSLVINLPGGLTYTNNTAITVPASAALTTLPLTLYEGRALSDNVVYNGHTILIDTPNVDVESIFVTLDNIQWTRVRTFGNSSSNSPHYIVVPEENGAASIFFGEDGYGLAPQLSQAVKLNYRTTKGIDGNGPLVFGVQISSASSFRNAISVTMATASTGGSSPETLSSIKNNVPLYFSSKKAAINVDITEAILNTYPEVKKSKATVIGDTVYFRIIPVDGSIASDALLADLADRLTPNLMLGYKTFGQQTSYVDIGATDIDVFVLKGYNVNDTLTNVKQFVQDFTDPLVLAKYGDSFDLTTVSLLIRSKIPGVQQVVFNTVNGTSPQSIVVESTKILKKVLDSNLTIHVNVIQ